VTQLFIENMHASLFNSADLWVGLIAVRRLLLLENDAEID